MSASNKKRLRKEQTADVLTAKQTQEQAEAKKLKIYTISFLAAMLVVVIAAVSILGIRAVRNSGVIEKNTIAAHIGDRELNSVELSYYYVDSINNFYNEINTNYGDSASTYLQVIGLDTSKPLTEQIQDEETNTTWAQYFVNAAVEQAASDYALYDLAMSESYAMTETDQSNYDNTLGMLNTYATIYGYSNPDQYLRMVYGYGSTMESYGEYYERSIIANSYFTAYKDRLTYTADDRNAYSADKEVNFNSYTYDSVYLSYTNFREGGTEGENGQKTYSDAENEAARQAMKEAADSLATATSVADLKEKVAAVKVTGTTTLSVQENKDTLYNSISTALTEWLTDASRQDGDIVAIPVESTTTAEDGTETTVVNGYYVLVFHSSTDNTSDMADLCYIFTPYEGGKTDEETKETVYTDEEKAAAKSKVEGFLDTWTSGEKTRESFEKLADDLIAEEKATSGGLVEDIHINSEFDHQIVHWAVETEHAEGDTTIVEADNGFYLLYYVGKGELNYREYMIETEMRAADFEEWYNGVIENVTTSVGDLSKMNLAITLG